jgi:hypothetical protein
MLARVGQSCRAARLSGARSWDCINACSVLFDFLRFIIVHVEWELARAIRMVSVTAFFAPFRIIRFSSHAKGREELFSVVNLVVA